MVLEVTNTNNVKVYTVSGSSLTRKLPDWLVKRKRRELQKDIEWTRRIELIQDFGFPEASLRLKVTPDGQFCMATGVYKPQIRVFDFANVAMKFDRHTDAENVNFCVLSDDWTKSVHLQNDRSIEFHNEGQMHFRTRIPRFGRDLAYHSSSCDVLVGGASSEVFRVNIDQGRFMTPLQTQSEGVNVVRVSQAHELFAFGTQDGTVEFWDPRARNRIGVLEPEIAGIVDPINGTRGGFEISAMDFRNDGLGVAVGTSSGHVLLYDLRQSRPWQTKDQQYGLPIKTVKWMEQAQGAYSPEVDSAKIMSADARIIKLWSVSTGKVFTSIEPTNDINDVCHMPNSGLLFVAGESAEIQSYFIPQLGPAPAWAHFLENLTEEMEQKPQQTIYDDYKFVVRRELESLGLSHLIGSPVLKPYMHGFFVDLRLYERAKAIANPFAYDDYRMQRVQDKLQEARESRIRATTKLPKVNRSLAMRLMQMQKGEKGRAPDSDSDDEQKRLGGRQRRKAQVQAATATAVLEDSRFKDIFNNPDFEVDEDADEFKQLHTPFKKMKLQGAKARADDDSSEDDMGIRDAVDVDESDTEFFA
ncbi:Small ribosomal subunit biogenesis [Coemansia sp. RSA 2523]|nr:Small ribosomal subunit biogenesis [Coemansia sp. RSA 1752]KAJ1775578.1 Small ribosomal subunit biogenesis [Coemansia sp. RSA 1824]KAJ1805621.1 Small ribosomal subunit biogenesis [Coemansia sp. RSA 2523]KAJ2258642.1 Small ribosomal subunit biogenesis [Coemansia sp. RSA 454]KAJ2837002.1 Small ribosomal subunit biogenesis [Coemansia erecta]